MSHWATGLYIAALALIGGGVALQSVSASMIVIGALVWFDLLMGAYIDAIKHASQKTR